MMKGVFFLAGIHFIALLFLLSAVENAQQNAHHVKTLWILR